MATNPRLVATIEAEEPARRLAVLIDADNAQASVIPSLLAEVARFGEATVRRIYGDFTTTASAPWKKVLNVHAIKAVQQFAYTTGKNATDSTLIIDAMDLLYTRRFDGFCLVSSDSDFTGLALRIREEGLLVYGFGEQKTPEAFRNACHKFIFTEVLRPVAAPETVAPAAPPAQPNATPARPAATSGAAAQPVVSPPASTPSRIGGTALPIALFRQVLEQSGDEQGWLDLGQFGNQLTKLRPDFDARNFGYKKLSELVKAHPEIFVIDERTVPETALKVLYIRLRS